MKRVQCFFLCALLSVSLQVKSQEEVIAISDQQITSTGIVIGNLEKVTTTFGKTLPGQIVVPPEQLQVVSAPQAGMVEKLLVAVGDWVEKGQLIAYLQSPDMMAVQRDYLQSLAQEEYAQQAMARDKSLLDEGVISQRRYQETLSRFQELEAIVAERRQALKLSGMDKSAIEQLTKNRKITARIKITSPIGGVVLDTQVESGQRLAISDPLFRIGQLDKLWVEVRAPLESVHEFRIGDQLHIHGEEMDGKLIAIGQKVDGISQTVLLRGEIINESFKLRPGQYIQVAHVSAATGPQFQLPSKAIARMGNQSFLFVKVATGFVARPVTVQAVSGDNVLVSGDFQGDEAVAISGIAAIKGAWAGLGGGD